MNRALTVFLAFLSFSHVADASRPFELYEPIIDKCLFGPPPDDPAVIPEKNSASAVKDEKEIAMEQERLEKAVAVSALQQTPDGTVKVGFSDSSASKTPIHYYLAVGETKDGWLVKSADVVAKSVILKKDSVEIERTLGASALPPASAGGGKAMGGNLLSASNGGPLARRSSLLSPRGSVGGAGSPMKSRRQLKLDEEASARRASQEEIARVREAEARRREEERARHEAERAEHRQMLMDLKDEIKKQREEQAQRNAAGGAGGVEEVH